uniref:Uncharacterized protein n=1 Tax=Acidithiobacillus sulfuriphilus TaxID=1867749 RepID=A0A3M8QR50_9PROT|nr:hypothetical protein EC580_13450 [Acidithiobacillus sulfuriphilus]
MLRNNLVIRISLFMVKAVKTSGNTCLIKISSQGIMYTSICVAYKANFMPIIMHHKGGRARDVYKEMNLLPIIMFHEKKELLSAMRMAT